MVAVEKLSASNLFSSVSILGCDKNTPFPDDDDDDDDDDDMFVFTSGLT